MATPTQTALDVIKIICTPSIVEQDSSLCDSLDFISFLCNGSQLNAAIFEQSPEFWTQLTEILKSRIASSASVAGSCLGAIQYLSRSGDLKESSNTVAIRLLNKCGVYEAVMNAMQMFGSKIDDNLHLIKSGCDVIRNLSLDMVRLELSLAL